MIYRLPTLQDRSLLLEYVKEHHDNGESSINASLGLQVSDYDKWIDKIEKNAQIGNEDWGKSLLFLAFEDETLIGLLSIRYQLSIGLRYIYGDIGYGVRPSERRKGYASKMLKFALSVCKEKGMKEVILGCYKDNIASAKVIIKNGGILIAENDNYKAGRQSQYYQIKL